MTETATALRPEDIVQAIRDRTVVRLATGALEGAQYYADRHGHIYSLNNSAEPKAIEQKEGSGLMWVVLYQTDGRIGRFMVGDLIADIFLDGSTRQLGEETVTYNDGNPRNNCADNLVWATRHELNRQLRALSEQGANAPNQARVTQASYRVGNMYETAARTRPVSTSKTVLPMLKKKDHAREKLLKLESDLAGAEKRINTLEKALAPFAQFCLSPKHQIGPGTAIVVESNRGTQRHSALRVHDLRVAAEVMNKTGQEAEGNA